MMIKSMNLAPTSTIVIKNGDETYYYEARSDAACKIIVKNCARQPRRVVMHQLKLAVWRKLIQRIIY